MKKILMACLSLLTLAVSTGCGEWLDINDNPNYVSEVSESSLLPTGIMLTAARVGYEYTLVGYFWAHYAVQCDNNNQYNDLQDNNLTNQSSYFYNPWRQAYYAILPTLKEIVEKCADDETKLNYVMMAKTMTAFNYHMLASSYERAVVSEALHGEANLTPNYDSAEDTYKSVLAMLAEVVAMDVDAVWEAEDTNPTGPNDMLFEGNIDNWFKFANTLYLKMLMRDFDTNKSTIQSVLASELGFLDEADAAFDHFADAADKSNPLYESDRRQLNTNANMGACSDIQNVLSADDPRLLEYYDNPNNLPLTSMGVAYNVDAKSTENWRVKLAATDPVFFSSVAEAEFLQAEAYARLGDAAQAQAHYEEGIYASFDRWGLDGTEFVEGDYAFKAGDTESMVEQIINQKWAAACRTQTWDAWWDINRTGYPQFGKVLTAYSGTLEEGYPRRFLFTYLSSDYNPNAPAVVGLNVKQWWHK